MITLLSINSLVIIFVNTKVVIDYFRRRKLIKQRDQEIARRKELQLKAMLEDKGQEERIKQAIALAAARPGAGNRSDYSVSQSDAEESVSANLLMSVKSLSSLISQD